MGDRHQTVYMRLTKTPTEYSTGWHAGSVLGLSAHLSQQWASTMRDFQHTVGSVAQVLYLQ